MKLPMTSGITYRTAGVSEFTGEGFDQYPAMHVDRQKLWAIGDMVLSSSGAVEYVYPTEYIEAQVNLYGRTLQRDDLLPSHRIRADRILDGYIFELAYRDGVYGNDE